MITRPILCFGAPLFCGPAAAPANLEFNEFDEDGEIDVFGIEDVDGVLGFPELPESGRRVLGNQERRRILDTEALVCARAHGNYFFQLGGAAGLIAYHGREENGVTDYRIDGEDRITGTLRAAGGDHRGGVLVLGFASHLHRL